MNFTLETPALIFPAISLLMLAYTNRFVVLADLIRNLYAKHLENPNALILAQIENLQLRMHYIKMMQVFGATAFVSAVISMLLSMLSFATAAWITFFIGLAFLLISLFYLLKELFISINALSIQLDELKTIKKRRSL